MKIRDVLLLLVACFVVSALGTTYALRRHDAAQEKQRLDDGVKKAMNDLRREADKYRSNSMEP